MPSRIRVINKATMQSRLPEVMVYVGRPTKLGNPFRVTVESQRDMIIGKYEEWLRARINAHDDHPVRKAFMELVEAVKSGKHLALACTCAPRRCHADIIKKLIEEHLEANNG